MNDGRNRLIRIGFSVVSLLTLLVGLQAFTPGFDVTGPGLLVFLVLGGIPFGFYLWGVKTAPGSILTGLLLLGLVAFVQVWVSTNSGHSTAGVSYIGIFLGGWLVVFTALILERLVRQADQSG